ncbi:cystathionine beta-lyase [Variovorax sp. J2L1-78]|nr:MULTISPECIES: cystathionine beta-lyase [unclassified Variovorax]MDM0119543.1 cystathionine beta-lyase [Variovorax sp. J2L1-78]MDM0128545.1 cystathionine beta-lyase [Variovorax sp. J2L1-63]MDM0232245.1 cystathionine beta-lyase [Variovorax sp. J2R1-6]
MVNTPVFRGSTILSNSLTEWESRKLPGNPYASYGRFGTPTTRALETALAELEGGYRSIVFPSGLAACTHSLLALLQPGDHALISDSVYGPTRSFATKVLTRFGIDVEFFDPLAAGEIRRQIRPSTRVVFVESPGSTTFEVQDIPAIAEEAHKVDAFVVMDNTWATPLFFKPFEHGVDISVQAATKYIVGHSDALLGAATANERAWALLQQTAHDFGQTAGPDDLYLALRGLRSLAVRLHRHWENGVLLAESMARHPMVAQVLHPALPGDAGHALWRRDFRGASGLFGVALKPVGREALGVFFDSLELFGIGLSWGGYESLALPVDAPTRAVRPWALEGPLLRIHAGLESCNDLMRDMQSALDRMQRHL